jgi:hypothetical protein
MSNKFDAGRRRTSGIILKTMALSSVASMVRIPVASAQDLPHLEESDATAVALKYVHDASKADRPDKAGVAGTDQDCTNCQFIQGDSGDWRPCLLFPGKSVNAKGWCISWIKKA